MNLSRFPRRRYTYGSTPIEKLSRLTSVLGGPTIYIKRDDLLGLFEIIVSHYANSFHLSWLHRKGGRNVALNSDTSNPFF